MKAMIGDEKDFYFCDCWTCRSGRKASKSKQLIGEEIVSFLEFLFRSIVAISSLGASLTFNLLGGQLGVAVRYTDLQIRRFLALSFLCFLVDLGLAAFSAVILYNRRGQAVRGLNGRSSVTWQWLVIAYTGALQFIGLTAFVFIALVVVAYAPAVGWVVFGFTAFFAVVVSVIVVHQIPSMNKRKGKACSFRRCFYV